ncbi:MAG: SAM hydrolase/SAM-dependent halogenase family protein, partial [Acidimicrobiales bacterium]
MGRTYDTISFLSDYGLDDEFVGVVKSVIRGLAPAATVIDITHGVAPYDVRAGALALVRSVEYLAAGVVLAVVDPGVGTDRRAVAVEVGEAGESVLVGPDNGLLAPAVAMVGGALRAAELTNTDFHLPSHGATFAGRDVFAPAAAHLCRGADLAELGELVDPVTLRPAVLPLSSTDAGRVSGEVLWVDRFGNLQLNVGPDEVVHLGERLTVGFGGDKARTARRVRAYAELAPGELGLVVDSSGLLSVA